MIICLSIKSSDSLDIFTFLRTVSLKILCLLINLTEGVVSICLHQLRNDIGYRYKNMTEAYSELENLSEGATSLEKTIVLMKLGETLTDEKESEVLVTIP